MLRAIDHNESGLSKALSKPHGCGSLGQPIRAGHDDKRGRHPSVNLESSRRLV
jgi:hypothetical protein